MTILFDPSRKVNRRTRRFGSGLLASRPAYKAPYTASDLVWLIAQPSAEDRHYDELAGQAEALDRLTNGTLF